MYQNERKFENNSKPRKKRKNAQERRIAKKGGENTNVRRVER